jgi:hypothetical protein
METILETDYVTWVPDAQDAPWPDVKQLETGSIIWNYYKIDGAQSKQGGAKNAMCTFCDSSFTGCSTSLAFAHILGRAVLSQKKQKLEHVCQYVEKMIIGMHNSKQCRKFSTRK